MEYVSSSLMAADIYTKAFVDPSKWVHLCNQIQLFIPEHMKSGNLVDFYDILGKGSSPRCINQPDRMPEELTNHDSGFGWHSKNDDFHYVVVREPKLFRTHTDATYCFRSTWIKTMTGWNNIEDNVLWTSLACHTQKDR